MHHYPKVQLLAGGDVVSMVPTLLPGTCHGGSGDTAFPTGWEWTAIPHSGQPSNVTLAAGEQGPKGVVRPETAQKWPGGQGRHSEAMGRNILEDIKRGRHYGIASEFTVCESDLAYVSARLSLGCSAYDPAPCKCIGKAVDDGSST